jgi:hypothetical protein
MDGRRLWMVDRMVSAWGARNQRCLALGLVLGVAGCGGTVVEPSEDSGAAGTSGGTADVPVNCVGNYEGSFEGDIRGRLTGSLDANADFVVTFELSGTGQSATGSGNVGADGRIEVVLGANSVTGRFNFNRCRANGDWVMGEARGDWNAKRQ